MRLENDKREITSLIYYNGHTFRYVIAAGWDQVLSLTFHCLSLTCHCPFVDLSLPLLDLSLPFLDLSLPFLDLSLPLLDLCFDIVQHVLRKWTTLIGTALDRCLSFGLTLPSLHFITAFPLVSHCLSFGLTLPSLWSHTAFPTLYHCLPLTPRAAPLQRITIWTDEAHRDVLDGKVPRQMSRRQ